MDFESIEKLSEADIMYLFEGIDDTFISDWYCFWAACYVNAYGNGAFGCAYLTAARPCGSGGSRIGGRMASDGKCTAGAYTPGCGNECIYYITCTR